LEKSRKDYEDLKNSLIITVYGKENFLIDEYRILSVKQDVDIDINSKQKDLKLKFNNTLKDLLDLYFCESTTRGNLILHYIK
jgi:hypothetical protein